MRASSRRRSVAKLFGQLPADQRCGLVQRADLPLQQRQVVQRVEDEVLALVGPGMTGDLRGAAGDYYFMDITADQHLTMAILGRHRVVVAAVTYQRQRVDPCGLRFTGIVGSRWQR
jgi:hypothetical protein